MMLQFTYKLKITERVKGKCSRHPRYNPEKDGRAGIHGACSCCFSLYDLYQARIALDAAQREFIRRAAPWARSREPRRTKAAGQAEPSSKGNELPIIQPQIWPLSDWTVDDS
jgi:hypothetical protein